MSTLSQSLNTLPNPVPNDSIVLFRYKTVLIKGFLAIGPFFPSAKSIGDLSFTIKPGL